MLKNVYIDVTSLENCVKIAADAINDYRAGSANPLPLLYQSGYLTIKNYNEDTDSYSLGFPNEEVKYGFYKELLPVYMKKTDIFNDFFIGDFIDDLHTGNVDSFMIRLKAFFAGISYDLENKKEKNFQTVFYIFFKLMGQFIDAELKSAKGRADAVVKTPNIVYVFEFKITERASAEDALNQIDNRGYAIPFTAGNRKIIKVGAEFSLSERGLSKWEVKEEFKN
jgi:hypothetical protein